MMKTPKNQQSRVNSWNRQHAVGTPVSVMLDGSGTMSTKTASPAWLLGGHTAVIKVEGISGGYMLSRVTVI